MSIRFTSILYKKNQKRRTLLTGTVLIGSKEYIFSGDSESYICLTEKMTSWYLPRGKSVEAFINSKTLKGFKNVDLDKCNYRMKWPNAINKIECDAIALTLKK